MRRGRAVSTQPPAKDMPGPKNNKYLKETSNCSGKGGRHGRVQLERSGSYHGCPGRSGLSLREVRRLGGYRTTLVCLLLREGVTRSVYNCEPSDRAAV